MRWHDKCNTVNFTSELVDYVEKSTNEFGYSNKRMFSGPGRDVQFVIDVIPSAMKLVPSVDVHSHCELEYTSTEDCLN